ncbi:MAG: type II secretion system secretin GspD [Deltaproteobacteria bacterium]|jgi:general secretion pathway protein D|nr:type II secretion system secretin GspD [Deltaproteobacteria bacterium]
MRKYLVKTIFLMGMLMGAVLLYAGCASKAPTTREIAKDKAPLEAGILEDSERNLEKAQRPTETSDEPREPTLTASAVEVASSAPGRASRISSTGPYESPATQYKKRYSPRRRIRQTSSLANDGPEAEGQIIFNFDDADLYEVIKTMAELLEINYIVDPGIQGKVTIHTARKLKKTDLFPVFSQILALNGLTAMKEGSLYKIVPMKDAPRMPMDTVFTLGQKDVPPMNRVIIQIIPLKYISTQEMTKLITPFLSSGGTIVASVPTNTLVVVDKGSNILKILQLMGTFDVNLLDRVYYRFFPLEYLGAEEVAGIVNEFTASYAGSSGEMVKFIALERLNTLLAVSTTPEVFDKIEELVHQIDIVDETVAARIYIYFVKNGGANELATLLNDVLTGKETQEQEKKNAGGASEIPGNPFSKAKMAEKKAEKKAEKAGKSTQKSTVGKKTSGNPGEGSSTLMGEMTITPDEIRNALIIESTPADYKIIQGILKKLDIMPRQVLIQATIAEIKLDSSTKFGVEYALGQGAGALGAGFMATVGAGGLKYSIGVTNKWYAELNALATKGRLNVISSPHVLASDNQEAKIDVSQEIPLASGTTNVSSGSTISETTIEYRDTGVILSVTPHINERGLVTMDISEEVSNYDGNINVGKEGNEYPVFSKRVVKTTLTVGHGQTVAIGGLIRDREREETRGLPCLIDVPVIKYLTGSWSKETEKIELIVLITPRVVDDMDDVEAMTNEFKQKVQSVMKQFYPQQ